MNLVKNAFVRGFAAPLTALFLSSSLQPCVMAQDAFNSISADDSPFACYGSPTVDSFDSSANAPQLQGATYGRISQPPETPEQKQEKENIATITGAGVRILGDEFRRSTRLPCSRVLLGLSICDLSYRPIVCDEVTMPVDMPPLPKQITLSGAISEAQIVAERVPGSSFESAQTNMETVSGKLSQHVYSSTPDALDVVVPAEAVEEMGDANYAAACNPDFGSRFAAYCMELEHTGRVPSYLHGAVEGLRKAELLTPAPYRVMARLKLAIANIPASQASPKERASLAARLENDGRVFEALVERLRCVDLLDDGPSRLDLAKLYNRLREPKLGFETLRDAAQKSWPKSQSSKLAEVHYLMGCYISALSSDALKNGNANLAMVRLRNASSCFRRAVCLNRSNSDAVLKLVSVAKQGATMDDSFDNQLMLGGAYLLAGDLERAQCAYEQCEAKNRGDRRLRVARAALEATMKRNKAEGLVSLR